MGTLLKGGEDAGPDLAKLPPSPAPDGDHAFSEITPKGKHAANAAAGALQMQKELATPSAFSLAAVLRRYAAASKACQESQTPGNDALMALTRVADEVCQWLLDRRYETLVAELAALNEDDRGTLYEAPYMGSDPVHRGEVFGRVFLAADDAARNGVLGGVWLTDASFTWVSEPAELARLAQLLSSGRVSVRLQLNLRIDELTRSKLATLGPVPAIGDVKAEEVEREGFVDLRTAIASMLKRGDPYSAAIIRTRWAQLSPALRASLLADAWEKPDAATISPSEIYLFVCAEPEERQPWLTSFVEFFAKAPPQIGWVELDVAADLNQVRTEIPDEARARFDLAISQINGPLAEAMGIVKAAQMSGVLSQWPIVDAVVPPSIKHDHGHLDDGRGGIDESLRRPPTEQDIADRNFWMLKLVGAKLLRRDLVDATRAYQHFLEGSGRDLEINYEKYLTEDPSGVAMLEGILGEAREAAIAHSNDRGERAERFTTQMQHIPVGGDGSIYAYPATENWQKAIGAHSLWAWANVVVDTAGPGKDRTFTLDVHLASEDRYNFNPGADDIATKTPDSVNGRFEITGLGKEFMSRGKAKRTLSFVVPAGGDGRQPGAASDAAPPVVEPAVDDPAGGGSQGPSSVTVPGKAEKF